jgi:phosphoenolpyruvate---glycerone phosphotransferase subunit DhaL
MSQTEKLEFVVQVIAQTAMENEKYFCDLDAVVGDGDFGYSLARGFENVLEQWGDLDRSTPGNFLKKIATIIVGRVGGVSGTVWGTAFLRAGMALGNKNWSDVAGEDVIAMFRSAIEGIKKRGMSDLGDKTLLDALVPAIDTLEQNLKEGKNSTTAIGKAALAARERAEATRSMIAKRGRAAYTGERSIGTLDAGAVAVAVMFEKVSQAWNERAISVHATQEVRK